MCACGLKTRRAASGFLFLLLLLPLLLAMCACRQYEQRKRERVMFVRERDVVVETDDDQQPIVYGQSSMGQVHGGRYRNRQVALKPLFPLPVPPSPAAPAACSQGLFGVRGRGGCAWERRVRMSEVWRGDLCSPSGVCGWFERIVDACVSFI